MSDTVSSDWYLVGHEPEGVHTRDRPPHLNSTNFPSTQADGPTHNPAHQPAVSAGDIENDLAHMTLGEDITAAQAAKYPPSLDTGSTLTADTPTFNRRHITEDIDVLLFKLNNTGAPSDGRLTAQALQVLDHDNVHQGYRRDLAMWCQEGYMFAADTRSAELSDSLITSKRAHSRVTEKTTSSCCLVSHQTTFDSTGEYVSGAGGLFAEEAAPPQDQDIIMEM